MNQLKKSKGLVFCKKRGYNVLFKVCSECPSLVNKEGKIFCKGEQ